MAFALSPLNRRRWKNFRANRRAYISLIVMAVLYGLSIFAELLANDHPLAVRYRGEWRFPVISFYSEKDFGGDFATEAVYPDPVVQCLILSGGMVECFDEPETLIQSISLGRMEGAEGFEKGFILWPPVPYSYNTINNLDGAAPSPPDAKHWLGTDDTARDVLARIIYGFRLSITFALLVTVATSVLGIMAGAVQGYFGGRTDLLFQRFIEIWSAVPTLYVIIIISAIWQMNFWLMVGLMVAFGWMGLVGVVRAEFLRARNFEYVRAAQALGLGDMHIMVRHVLPNAMVATLTLLPFAMTGAIGSLAALDYLGFGLPNSLPSLGELTQQAKGNLQAPWLAFSAFMTFAIMLALLVFIFEGVRDAFDPRKTFR